MNILSTSLDAAFWESVYMLLLSFAVLIGLRITARGVVAFHKGREKAAKKRLAELH